MHSKHLILASSSPRRKSILEQIGLKFNVIPSELEESKINDFTPECFTEYWARKKAKYVGEKYPESLIIGADTVVFLNEMILYFF